MIMTDFKDFFEKRIRIITFDDKMFEGVLTGFEDALDSSSGTDEIELDMGDCYIDVDIPSVKTVELI